MILWIHGGSLQTSSTPHQMWGIPAYYDVIVVTIQYRLGPFGFMTMNDETAPANVGLRDQVKALLWIRFKFCTDCIVLILKFNLTTFKNKKIPLELLMVLIFYILSML